MPSHPNLIRALTTVEPGLDIAEFLNDKNALQMMLNAANVEKFDLIETIARQKSKIKKNLLEKMSNDQLRKLMKTNYKSKF